MVGFQTKMTYAEQRRVFRLIPGLEKAEFVRLGSLHRNTFIDSPRLLRPTLQFKGRDDLFFAGQMIGVEGYLESAAAGLFAGVNAARLLDGQPLLTAPPTTALGSMLAYVTHEERREFQPMNTNYGLFPPLERRLRGREKKAALAERALRDLTAWQAAHGLVVSDFCHPTRKRSEVF
jgi:methylenetetrahydrofolate--tRNA-(uracil-5-)-methyltransferase